MTAVADFAVISAADWRYRVDARGHGAGLQAEFPHPDTLPADDQA